MDDLNAQILQAAISRGAASVGHSVGSAGAWEREREQAAAKLAAMQVRAEPCTAPACSRATVCT